MIALVVSGMAKFAAYSNAGQSITDLIAQLPYAIQTIFGLTGFDLSKASGFYGVLFIYIALMATVHAVLLGTDIISKEERDKTFEFLFVKPISRAKVITAKVFAGLFSLLVLNLITFVTSLYSVSYFGKGDFVGSDIMLMMAGLLFLQLLFFFAGAAIAAVSKKPKSASSLATSAVLFSFIVSFLVNISSSLDPLKYLTPFKYFDAKTMMADGRLDPLYVTISLVVIVGLIVTTYVKYPKKDLV